MPEGVQVTQINADWKFGVIHFNSKAREERKDKVALTLRPLRSLRYNIT